MTKHIVLTITRADGSIYWVDHFPDIVAKDAWLKSEMTRPYWQKDFVTSWVDQGAITDAQIEAAKSSPEAMAQKAKDEALAVIKAKADGIKSPADIVGLPETKALLFEILQRIKKLEGV